MTRAIAYGCIRDGMLVMNEPGKLRATVARWPDGPIEVELRPRRSKRSKAQNDGFHAMIAPWVQAEGDDPDRMKRILLREVFGTLEKCNPITGVLEPEPAKPHTSALTVEEFSLLIERTLQIAADCGYVLTAPDEWRDRERLAGMRE